MKEDDYYSVMEKRIKYLSQKYDPLNRYPLSWESKRNDDSNCISDQQKSILKAPIYTKPKISKLAEAITSVFAFLI